MGALKPWHWVVMVVLVVLLFGAGKLPSLARNLGKSMRIFKSEVDELKREAGLDKDPEEEVDALDRRYSEPAARPAQPAARPAEPVQRVEPADRPLDQDPYRRD